MMNRKEIILEYFKNSIDIDKDIFSGKPVLKGTRFPVDQILSTLIDYENNETTYYKPFVNKIKQFCNDYDLNYQLVECFILDLYNFFDYIDKKDFRSI